MTNEGIINRSISSILGIDDTSFNYSSEDLYHGLGFSIVHRIITNARFKPIIIDMTVQAKKKWTAMGFGETQDEARQHLSKYISSVKEIIEQKRSILLHPNFQSFANTILCLTAMDIEKEVHELTIDSHLNYVNHGMVLFQYINDILPNGAYSPDTTFSPQQNAAYLYSLFCKLMKSKNYIFISVPITRRSIDSKKELKRELMGGVFMVLQNGSEEPGIETLDNLTLKIIAAFHKGLIDWQENRESKSIYDIDIGTWINIRNIGSNYLEVNNPHHWPFGGSSDQIEKEIYMNAITYIKHEIIEYVNDIDTHPPYEWESWEKPPIRALVQLDSLANDLSNFFAKLENSLSSKFKFKVVFYGTGNSNALHYDTLWFNAIALGKAIFHICQGFQQLKDEHKKTLTTQNKVVVEWGWVYLENKNYLYLKLFELFDFSTSKMHVTYAKDCWIKSKNSLKFAFPFLQNSGVKKMIYSGYDYSQQTYKSQEISLTSGEYKSKEVVIDSYKKSPPFLFFGIEAKREELYFKAMTDYATESSDDILRLFKREYNENNCD